LIIKIRGKKEEGRRKRGGSKREEGRNNKPQRHRDTKEEENFPILPNPQSPIPNLYLEIIGVSDHGE
jgi:hypothetical protein